MNMSITEISKLISKTVNDLYPDKYVVTINSNGDLGLYYPQEKRIVSPITITDTGYVVFFNNCNDLMDDFNRIGEQVNAQIQEEQIADKVEHDNQNTNKFYVLKIGNYFMNNENMPRHYSDPTLTDKLANALILTDDDFEDDEPEAIQYYTDMGFKLCEIDFKELNQVPV